MRMFGGRSDGLAMVADLMGSSGRSGADKCILTSFGKLSNGGAVFRVRHMHIHAHMHHTLTYIHICTTHTYTFTYITYKKTVLFGVVHMLLYVYVS
jgi:hypothetical protein